MECCEPEALARCFRDFARRLTNDATFVSLYEFYLQSGKVFQDGVSATMEGVIPYLKGWKYSDGQPRMEYRCQQLDECIDGACRGDYLKN